MNMFKTLLELEWIIGYYLKSTKYFITRITKTLPKSEIPSF